MNGDIYVTADDSDRVYIEWRLPDGTVYQEIYTIPPADVRRARTLDQKWREKGATDGD